MYSLRAIMILVRAWAIGAGVTYAAVITTLLLLAIGCAPQPTKETLKEESAADKADKASKASTHGHERGEPEIRLSTVAWSPDGELLLAGYHQDRAVNQHPDEAHRVTVWDVKTGQRVQVLKGHDGNITFVGFLPDSKRAVTAGGSTVKMWDARTGKQLWSAKPHPWLTESVAMSPDGKFLLAWGHDDEKEWRAGSSASSSLNLIDTATGKLNCEFGQYKGQVVTRTLRFAPDSRHAFIGEDPRLLDVTTGETTLYHTKDEEWKRPLAFTPDGKLVLSRKRRPGIGPSPYLVLWELASGKLIRRFEDRSGSDDERRAGLLGSRTLAFTPDGRRVLSGDYDGKVRIWDAATGKLISSVILLDNDPSGFGAIHGPPKKAIVWLFSPDGKMALTSNERKSAGQGDTSIMFSLWDVSNGKKLRRFQFEPGYKGSPDFNPYGP